jgi:glycosyltransferase involved in cell wall biosynthesis
MASRIRRVLYLAAHGGFAGQPVPLGGAAAVANLLEAEWARTRPFDLEILGPSLLGSTAPSAQELVRFNERQYAAFCGRFHNATTREALRHDPRDTAILVNDLAEGPDFARLARAGFHIVTLYHVDVVAYIASIYLRNRISAPALARLWERLRPVAAPLSPRILRLIFEQQRASLLHSARVVVPSSPMREILRQGYPAASGGQIEVLNWGSTPAESVPDARLRLAQEFAIPDNANVLVCLSRLSPEKGHDLLIEALIEGERQNLLAQPLWLFICGEPAFMQGDRYAARLRSLASRLTQTQVRFPGYVTGERKATFLQAASLYLFPSRHESYGLTLVEALAAGVPAITLDHAGAHDLVAPDRGLMIPSAPAGSLPRRLAAHIGELLADPARRARMGAAARRWADTHPFAHSAARLATLLQEA